MLHTFFSPLLSALPRLTLVSVIDIVVVAVLVFQFLMVVRGRRAAHILTGLLILGVAYVAAAALEMELLSTLLTRFTPYVPFALIVVFQSEIRRMLSRIGQRRLFSMDNRIQRREFADEIV